MKHPNPQIQKNQEDFLQQLPESERGFHAQLFRIGNMAIQYHQLVDATNGEVLELYYREWLEGLPDNIQEDMNKRGFEKCRTILSFTRYVNERKDLGMDEWMKKHLSEEDYLAYKSNSDKSM